MNKPKVIILYNKLFHYRIPVWNCLADKCDLTVAYSEGGCEVPDGVEMLFTPLYIPAIEIGHRFVFQKANIRKLVKGYDAIIAYGNITWLKYSTLPWFGRNKVIFHTIGVSASYDKGYDVVSKWDGVRNFFYRRASALVFYTDYPVSKYVSNGYPEEMLFVAHNTVAVHPSSQIVEKDSILFIGSLYRQKGIMYLLDSYKQLRNFCALPVLNIVGKGPDFDNIRQWIMDNDMSDIVNLAGPIYDIDAKAEYFARAIACISPSQAGLTVQESMGYGVPFVTVKNAISGGEIFDIVNGETGVLMNDLSELKSVILDISANKKKYELMGENAKIFYDKYRKPSDMADGLWHAVLYAMGK